MLSVCSTANGLAKLQPRHHAVRLMLPPAPARLTPLNRPRPEPHGAAGHRMVTGAAARTLTSRSEAAKEPTGPLPPTWHELYQAAVLARWAGFAYLPPKELVRSTEAEGLKLVAHGRNNYTSWFIADGSFSYSSFIRTTLDRPVGGLGSSLSLSSGSWNGSVDGDALKQYAPCFVAPVPPPGDEAPCRFVFVRGVHMSAPETNALHMWRLLADMWPSDFARDLTNPTGVLVSHPGVSSVAEDLFKSIAPYVQVKKPIIFAGHSLGGAISKLAWALTILHGCRPAAQMGVLSFGSPPVLAHKEGGGGGRVLEVLGASSAPPVDYVLQHDPVPRSMISVDPYFRTAQRYLPIKGLLQARSWLLGSGSAISSDRFLFESVGRMFMIQGGCQVVPVDGKDDVEKHMSMADIIEAVSQPGSFIQYWLDHHHSSYAHDLHSAAMSTLRRESRACAKRQASKDVANR